MRHARWKRLVSLFVVVAMLAVVGCATSPLGRRQLAFFPDAQLAEMGVTAFNQLKAETPVSKTAKTNTYVKCVADNVTAALTPGESSVRSWEVVVFESNDVNAFALPGGKIGVYTGLLGVAKTQDQLAAVIGHEIAHVLARHSNERVSTAYTAQAALTVMSETAVASPHLMALMGLGAQVGILMPFGRAQESEADLIGLDLMARAGFDPRQAITLWQNMGAARRNGAPPEFLSTHPSDATRIGKLNGRMPRAVTLYDAARNGGKKPRCG
jgi:predicted Zn-dependent protease